jgi:hypothetical protein
LSGTRRDIGACRLPPIVMRLVIPDALVVWIPQFVRPRQTGLRLPTRARFDEAARLSRLETGSHVAV